MATHQITTPELKESGDHSWYIEYWEIYPNGKKIRRKPTFNINRIKDLSERRDEAFREIESLCAKYGLDSSVVQIKKRATAMTLYDAVAENCAIQLRTYTKQGTIRTYKNNSNQFLKYLKLKKMEKVAAKDWSSLHVNKMFDYLKIEHKARDGKPLRNRTINNYKHGLITMFNDMIGRGYVNENHFKVVENLKKQQSIYQIFDESERDIVYKEIIDTDPILAFAITLIYRCAIRSYVEMVSLKPSSFKLKEGYITIKGEDSKTNKGNQFVTIPDDLLFYFAKFLKEIPQNWYIFGPGTGSKPHPTKTTGRNTFYERHKKIVQRLEREGKIADASNHPIYYWKKDGVMLLIKSDVDIHTVKEHCRHDDIATTAMYFNNAGVKIQRKIKNFKASVVPM